MHIDHRGTVKLSTLTLPGWVGLAFAETLEFSLSDPEFQWEFANNLPSPLAPSVLCRQGDLTHINVEY